MTAATAWQTAEIAGPKRALVIPKPEVVVAMVKRAKRPILIVGHKTVDVEINGKKLIDFIIKIANSMNITVVATAHTVKEFESRGYSKAFFMPIVDIANRLIDSDWKGVDGKGPYDLALFTGHAYYMEWLVLSGLKHFAQNLKTMSLDRFYQPNASWSFRNTSVDEWSKNIKKIVNGLEEK